ncbi:class I tRNA ligase family protein, partial [Salmonella enterica]|uniref:class I tRNA ligase family protein n=1 Tax=Salmonella enterica TaxID=28901 RepID=UPI0030135815
MHPATWTNANIDTMRGQMRLMGASFDWAREVVTCDPSYYRWQQWLFLKLYEAGLAYKAMG